MAPLTMPEIVQENFVPGLVAIVVVLLTSIILFAHRTGNKGQMSETSNYLLQRIASLPRGCIFCDACDKPAPSIQCDRCQTVYYCSSTCRKSQVSEHGPDCHDVAAHIRTLHNETPSKEELLSAASEDAVNSECGICLEEQMDQPVTLDCKHAFCSSCLVAWQRQKRNPENVHQFYPESSDRTHRCPLCRNETDGRVEVDLMLRSRLLASRANLLKKGDPESARNLLEKALDILNKLLQVNSPHLQAYITKVEILESLGEYQRVVDTVDEVVAINNERVEKIKEISAIEARIEQAMMRHDGEEAERLQQEYVQFATNNQATMATRITQQDVVELWIQQAEGHIKLGNWDTAKDILITKTQFLVSPDALSPSRTRRCVMGLARCAYETKRYDKAIAASEMAIEMNRSFPGVYLYKALSLKELGDMDAAIATMNRAVLYETPWDDDNRRKALEIYDKLLAEKEEQKE
mmetsp:Transcript_21210/g.32172  ORF Transcript_21210/g.32172 Transcript_21210/m.32172 type:complete len:465 (+) Transcript_21210:23-1417(+)